MSVSHADTQKLKTGTTTVGLIGSDCVVLAADQRASLGHIAYDEEAQKVYSITSHIGVTNAGSVGDSLTIIRYMKSHAAMYEIERNTKMTVKALSTFLSNILNANRYYPYISQFIIGGYNGKPGLFEVTPDGGMLERNKYCVSGSGTEFALATIDGSYKIGMNQDDTIALAVRAVNASRARDVMSGGKSVSVMVITKDGCRELSPSDVKKFMKDGATLP